MSSKRVVQKCTSTLINSLPFLTIETAPHVPSHTRAQQAPALNHPHRMNAASAASHLVVASGPSDSASKVLPKRERFAMTIANRSRG
jgi:hypothetical protein